MNNYNSIFNKKILEDKLKNFQLEKIKNLKNKQKIIFNWIYSIENSDLNKTKETSIQGDFLTAFFTDILGYKKRYGNKVWNITQEQETFLDRTVSDGALGYFTSDINDIRVVIELKDANTDLDKKQNNREGKMTPVEQAFLYSVKSGESCKWIIISNFKEIRLYYHTSAIKYEKFLVTDLNNENEFKRFYYLLCYNNLICRDYKSIVDELYDNNEKEEKEISKKFYEDYKIARLDFAKGLKENNPNVDELLLFEKAQKMMDRIVFICFCRDRELLPKDVLTNIKKIANLSLEVSNNKIWNQLKGLFYYIDKGNPPMNINRFNGGLFKEDKEFDNLNLPDILFDKLEKILEYDFNTDLNVNILGHIFEQSVSDIEEIKAEIQGKPVIKTNEKRKKDGIFYTPEYVTKYIVEQTIGRWMQDQKLKLGENKLPSIPDGVNIIDADKKLKNDIKKHIKFWEKYKDRLSKVKIVDYACGSGAFLNAAFNYLYQEGQNVNEILYKLTKGQYSWFDLDKQILKSNLYGVDINRESVEITKLSLWLKTANKKEPLTSLDKNILCGNSIINDKNDTEEKSFNWEKSFKNIFNSGGFDIVIGNPPYGAEFSREDKKYLDKNYKTLQYNYDSYKVFMELAFKIAKSNAYIGLITPNTYMVLEKSVELRKFIFENFKTISFVELFNVFPDAIVEPIISIFKKERPLLNNKFEVILMPRKCTLSDNFVTKGVKNEFIHKDLYKREGYVFNYHEIKIERELRDKIINESDSLLKYAIVTAGVKPYEKDKGKPIQTKEIVLKKPYNSFIKFDDSWKPFIRGSNVFRYVLKWGGEYIKYGECLAAPRKEETFYNPKIFIRQTGDELIAAYDDTGKIGKNTTHCIQIKDKYKKKVQLKYLLSLINSKIMNWIFQHENFHIVGKPLAETKVAYVERLPIIIDEDQNKYVNLVDKLMELNETCYKKEQKFLKYIVEIFKPKKISEKLNMFFGLTYDEFVFELKKQKVKLDQKTICELIDVFDNAKQEINDLNNDINSLENKLDEIIYKLYGLTDAEIKIIKVNNR